MKWQGKAIPCRRAEDGKGAETNSGKSGMRNLEAECIGSKQSGQYWRVCKIEDSHRDQMELCTLYIYSRCLSQTEFSVGFICKS